MANLAARLAKLEAAAQRAGGKLAALPEGMVLREYGGLELVYCEIDPAEWAEVEAILTDIRRQAGYSGPVEWPEAPNHAPLVVGGLELTIEPTGGTKL